MNDMERIFERAEQIVHSGWCQNKMVMNDNLAEVDVYDENGVYFCAVGAICRAIYERSPELTNHQRGVIELKALNTLRRQIRDPDHDLSDASFLVRWNDHTCETADDVVDAIKKARENLAGLHGIA